MDLKFPRVKRTKVACSPYLLVFAFFFLLSVSWSNRAMAQHLTISTSGETGTSGTNWSISGNTLSVGSSGSASIHPSVITDHLLNTGDLTINLPWQSTVGRNININNTIAYAGSSARTLTFESANDIVFANAVGITSATASLNVVLRSTMGLTRGNPDNGLIKMDGINIDTKGGHFWVGGGTSSTTWNGLTVGNSAAHTWLDDVPGISVVGSTIASGGGDIYMAAISWNSTDDDGVNYGMNVQNSNISSGAGDIYLFADLYGRYTNGIGLYVQGTTSITSTTGPIYIRGYGVDQSPNGNSWRIAASIQGSAQIKSVSGNITVIGDAAFTATANDKEGLNITDGAAICSQSGNITLRGTNTLETSGQYCNSIRFSAANVANSIRIGYDGTNAYSGNISIEGNSIYQRATNAGAGSIAVQTTGTLTIQPTGNAFTYMRAGDAGTLTYDDDWNFGTTLGGFVYGKSTNTTALTYSNALTTSGPITMYAGALSQNGAVSSSGAISYNCTDFTLGDGVNISTSTASDITINANGNFSTSLATRRTISSAGGNIIIHADKDANSAGQLDLDYLTLNPGTGATIIRGETVGYTTGSVAGPYINGTGSFTFESSDASFGSGVYTSWFFIDQDANGISGLTLGKAGSTADVEHNTNISIGGPITIYGGYVSINGNLTSSATGDIFIKGIAGTNPSIQVQSGITITKSGGTGTLTLQGHGRVTNYFGSITTSGTGVLNVIFWSDFDNDNDDGGVSQFGTISTNGGHVWLGGSSSNGGSYTWNGLTVGDGPSIGSSGYNAYAMDIWGNITTNGGDFLAWAGAGYTSGFDGIGNDGNGDIVSVGSGDIVLITDMVVGSGSAALYFTQSGGTFTLVPHGGSFRSTLNWNPTVLAEVGATADDYNFASGDFDYLGIGELNSISRLTFGYYNGMLSGGTPVEFTNSSNITFGTATTSAGAVQLYGGAIAMNANLTTTSTTIGNILLNGTSLSGTGNLAVAAGRSATINVTSTSTYDGIISGSSSTFTKSGAGLLTLTKDQTYSGTTTISGGDLQVGTGGSVSQASSGSLASASAVSVASGSKLILTPNENITFANGVSGDGGVEIKGASGLYMSTALTTTATLIASNVSVLEVMTRITGGVFGGSSASGNCGAYQKSYNAATNTATLQFQHLTSDNFTKVVFVTLERINTTNVAIRGTGAAYRSGNYLGQNMATIGGTTAVTFPTTYGISQVFMSGKVNFTGALTYTGTTTLSNTLTSATNPTYSYTSKGTQEITDASSSFPGAVVNNGLVILNRTTPLTIAGDMSGTEDVLQVGADVTFTGTNSYSGITTIDLNKTLNIGSGGSSGSMTGNIVNYGALTFNRTGSSTYPGVLSGTGSLTKSGAGDLTMNNLNTYTGATTINAGTLILERDVPASSSSGFSGAGALTIQPSSASFTSAVSWPIPGFPTVSSSIGGLTVGKASNTSSVTFSTATQAAGPISAYGGAITVSGALTAAGNILLDGDPGSFLTQNTIGVTVNAAVTTTSNGNITILGRGGSGNAQFGNNGVQITQTVEAGGSGTISVTGFGGLSSNGSSGSCHGINMDGASAWIKSNGGNVTVTGNGGGAGVGTYSQGVVMLNSSRISAGGSGILTITGTGGVNTIIGLRGVVMTTSSSVFTAGGAININGYHGTNGSDNSDGFTMDNATVGSNTSGPITITGTAGGGTGSEAISLSTANTIGGASHAGNITLSGNSFSFAGTNTVQTTGQVAIEPASTSFSAALNYPISNLTVTSTGLRLGKSGNTANLNFTNNVSVPGPITVYAGPVSLAANLTTTGSGDISIYSDASLTATGSRTATAAGLFKYMPDGTSFSSAVSYPIGNLTVSSNGLQLGKPGNTAALTITGAASSNGPVTVHTGAFTTDATATLTATGSALTVNASGNVTLNAALAGSSTTVNVQGNLQTTGSLTNVNLEGGNAQGISGTATLTNLTVNKSAGIATMTGGRQNLTGTLTLTAGTLAAGGYLTLKSSATGTARVAEHAASTGNVTGNVVVERFVPGSRKMQWRMLAFPYNADLTLSNITGIKINYTSPQTMMYFRENFDNGVYGTGGTRNGGYETYTSNSQTIPLGRGVAAWVYGDESTSATPGAGTLGAGGITVSSLGELNETGADVSIPITNLAAGWNLVGNPFASTIDWELVRAVGTNLSATLYRWDPQAENWTLFNNSGGTTGNGSRFIESGSAFFVKSAASGAMTLTIPQSAKVANAPDLHFSKNPLKLDIPGQRVGAASTLAGLRLKASGMGNPIPGEAYLDVSKTDATKGWDPQYDGLMMARSSGANVYFDGEKDNDYSMHFDAPLMNGEQRYYPITVTTPKAGETLIEVTPEGKWSSMHSVALIDKQLGRTILMRDGQLSYKLRLDELKSEGRFLLAINHVKLSADGQLPAFEAKALGNPVTNNIIDLQLTHPTAAPKRWRVVDAMGREAGMGVFATDAGIQHRLTVPGMRSSGVYVLQVEMDNGEMQQVRILKN